MTELQKRSQEVKQYAAEKKSLEDRISDLEGLLVTGGTHAAPGQAPVKVEDTEEFQHAIRKKEKELHEEYVGRMQEVEAEKKELAKAKEALDKQREEIAREREQLRPMTSLSGMSEYALDTDRGDLTYTGGGGRQWASRHGVVQNAWMDNQQVIREQQRVIGTLDDYVRALSSPETGIPLYMHSSHGPCFTGLDAADWFMENMEGVVTMEAAVKIGQKFLNLNVIAHVQSLTSFHATSAHIYVFTSGAQEVTGHHAMHGGYYHQAVPSSPSPAPTELAYSRPASSASTLTSDASSRHTPGLSDSPDRLLEEDAGSNALHAAAAKGDKSAVK